MRDVEVPERLLRLHELVRHGIGIKDFCAEGFEDGGDGAFAAGNAASETYDFHTLSPSQMTFDKVAKSYLRHSPCRSRGPPPF